MVDNHKINSQEEKNRLRRGQIIVWAVIIFVLAVIGLKLLDVSQGGVEIGDEVPDFILTTFDGQEVVLSNQRGKVVLINLWASWCEPCEMEAPDLQAAWEHYQLGGEVIFLGAAYSDNDIDAANYMANFNITYPSGHDLGTRIHRLFRASGVPWTYIVDQNGILVYKRVGPFTSLDEILVLVDSVLNK